MPNLEKIHLQKRKLPEAAPENDLEKKLETEEAELGGETARSGKNLSELNEKLSKKQELSEGVKAKIEAVKQYIEAHPALKTYLQWGGLSLGLTIVGEIGKGSFDLINTALGAALGTGVAWTIEHSKKRNLSRFTKHDKNKK